MTSLLPGFPGDLSGQETLTADTYRWLLDMLGLVDLFVDTVETNDKMNQGINETEKENREVELKNKEKTREEKRNVTTRSNQSTTTVSGRKRKGSILEKETGDEGKERLRNLKTKVNHDTNDRAKSLLAQHEPSKAYRTGNHSKQKREALYQSARDAIPSDQRQTSALITFNTEEHAASPISHIVPPTINEKQISPPLSSQTKKSSSPPSPSKSGITLKLPGLRQIHDQMQRRREQRVKGSHGKPSGIEKLHKLFMTAVQNNQLSKRLLARVHLANYEDLKEEFNKYKGRYYQTLRKLSAMTTEMKKLERQNRKGGAGRNRDRIRL